MKRKALLGAIAVSLVTAMTVGLSSISGLEMSRLSASILSSFENAVVFDDSTRTTKEKPQSPLLLNDFNLYHRHANEQELIALYMQYVRTDAPLGVASYFTESMSYVERVSRNLELNENFFELLPLWPDYNMATYGNMTAYLFPHEKDPLAFAIEQGFVKPLVKPGEFLSPFEVLNVVGRIFFEGDGNANLVLEDLGLAGEGWDRRDKGNFRVVDMVRLVLRVREYAERININAAIETSERQDEELSAGAVLLGESMGVLSKAFQAEAKLAGHGHRNITEVQKQLEEEFSFQAQRLVNADVIAEVRQAFYAKMGLREPKVYELPREMYLGDCANELHRKSYMGPVVKVPVDSYISCGRVTLQIPAGYIIGLNSLPKIGLMGDGLYRLDAVNSLKNVLFVGDNRNGETMVRVVYTPENLEDLGPTVFRYMIEDQQGNDILLGNDAYDSTGAEFVVHPRKLTGKDVISFQASK